jgi:hypothetical protein
MIDGGQTTDRIDHTPNLFHFNNHQSTIINQQSTIINPMEKSSRGLSQGRNQKSLTADGR